LLFFSLAIPVTRLINIGHYLWILTPMLIMTIFMTAIQGAISPLFVELFEPDWQTTGCAFSYSIGNGLSGASPLLALTFVHMYPVYGLGLFIMLLLIIGWFGFIFSLTALKTA